MSLATQLESFVTAQQAKDAARQVERAARDAFIQAQFPLLNARLLELVASTVGLHSRLAITTLPLIETVTGRSFATLNKTAVTVTAQVGLAPASVSFTPRLDFRLPGQFGAIDCSIDFVFRPRQSRAEQRAARLLANGVQMQGKTAAFLMVDEPGGRVELSAAFVESTLAALLLRG